MCRTLTQSPGWAGRVAPCGDVPCARPLASRPLAERRMPATHAARALTRMHCMQEHVYSPIRARDAAEAVNYRFLAQLNEEQFQFSKWAAAPAMRRLKRPRTREQKCAPPARAALPALRLLHCPPCCVASGCVPLTSSRSALGLGSRQCVAVAGGRAAAQREAPGLQRLQGRRGSGMCRTNTQRASFGKEPLTLASLWLWYCWRCPPLSVTLLSTMLRASGLLCFLVKPNRRQGLLPPVQRWRGPKATWQSA